MAVLPGEPAALLAPVWAADRLMEPPLADAEQLGEVPQPLVAEEV